MRFLLDVNVLVALAFLLHSSHSLAHSWFRGAGSAVGKLPTDPSRISPRGQPRTGGLARCHSKGAGWPGTRLPKARGVDLRAVERYAAVALDRTASDRGHASSPAHRHHGQLATFDTGLRELAAGTLYAGSVLLL